MGGRPRVGTVTEESLTRAELRERAGCAPTSPGVYQFLDRRGTVLYVGKAKNLRRRVLSYFTREVTGKTAAMLARARRLEFIVTATEMEALILENRLIKRHRPRYNITLRDDKTYPYVKLTVGERWPRALLTRRVLDDGHAYFGPFLGHGMAARIMDLIRTRTQVRTCAITIDGKLARPCLYYDLGACLAPCVAGLTTPEEYAAAVEEVTMLLEGRHRELAPRLEAQMWRAAERSEFERAARYRDLLRALDELGQGQHVEVAGSGSRDVIGLAGDGHDLTAVVLLYRDDRLVDKRDFHFEGIETLPDGAFLAAFLAQYYEANPVVPERIELPLAPDGAAVLGEFLRSRRGGAVVLAVPRRSRPSRFAALARANAVQSFELRFRQPRAAAERTARRLADLLGLGEGVRRIECLDVSHTGGEAQVASLVVWEDGKLRPSEYRTFNVRAGCAADDPAALGEAVSRRYRRRKAEGARLPELVVVDGGTPQLHAARRALLLEGVAIPVVALAKSFEEIIVDGRPPIHLEPNDPVRLLLQRVRDEAHRVAVTRHRRRRRARRLATQLLAVPGIGPARAARLLAAFGSLDGVRQATREALDRVVGPSVAAVLWRSLHPEQSPL